MFLTITHSIAILKLDLIKAPVEDNTASQARARIPSFQALSPRWPSALSQVVSLLVNL